MACDLEAARITSLPADAFYISDFVSEDEEEWLLQKVSGYASDYPAETSCCVMVVSSLSFRLVSIIASLISPSLAC